MIEPLKKASGKITEKAAEKECLMQKDADPDIVFSYTPDF